MTEKQRFRVTSFLIPCPLQYLLPSQSPGGDAEEELGGVLPPQVTSTGADDTCVYFWGWQCHSAHPHFTVRL